jgi:hypothetical protein
MAQDLDPEKDDAAYAITTPDEKDSTPVDSNLVRVYGTIYV